MTQATQHILELYPDSGQQRLLKNLYLNQIGDKPFADGRPFIYSNYINSLDGRIALPGTGRSHQVPPAIANKRDWRLFQELAASADAVITSARYFRQSADAEAQAELPVGLSKDFEDLRDWRLQQNMQAQPDVIIFSSSLNIPITALQHYQNRKVTIFTGEKANPDAVEKLSALTGVEIIFCGQGGAVDGHLVREKLSILGYQHIYAIAGPSVLHTLIEGDALDRLYLTTAHCLLGGTEFDTITWGSEFSPAYHLPLRALYLDKKAPEGMGQTMAIYGRA